MAFVITLSLIAILVIARGHGELGDRNARAVEAPLTWGEIITVLVALACIVWAVVFGLGGDNG